MAVKTLVQQGATLLIRDVSGQTPAQKAQRKDRLGIGYYFATQAIPYYNHKQFLRESLANKIRWIAIPWVATLIFWITVELLGIWAGFVAVGVMTLVVNIVWGHTFLGTDEGTTFHVGFFWGLYGLSTIFYLMKVFWTLNDNGYVTENYTFFALNVCFSLMHLYMKFSNPGFLDRNIEEDKKDFMKRVKEQRFVPDVCGTDMLMKPIRSKHCKVTDRCVAKFDHYCAWLNNAIGERNHKMFMVILLFVIALHVYFCRILIITMTVDPGQPSFFPLNKSIAHYFLKEPMLYTLMLFHFANGAWEVFVLYQQVSMCIIKDLTANEISNQRRYAYLKDATGQEKNPFDEGLFKNVYKFFFEKLPWDSLYTVEDVLNARRGWNNAV